MEIPDEMRRERLWTECRWDRKSDAEWFEMCSRFLSRPQSNFSYWDYLEADQLEEYLMRGAQVEEYYRGHENFCQNLANVRKALHHVSAVLASQNQVFPRYEGKMGLKQAMREGKSFKTIGGTMVGNRGLLDSLAQTARDLDTVMQLDADPGSVTPSEWRRLYNDTTSPLVRLSLNRCRDEVFGDEGCAVQSLNSEEEEDAYEA